MKKIFYITAFSIIATSNLHAILITGDPSAAAGETFSFDLGFAAFDVGSETSAPRLWIANNDAAMAGKADTVKPYGLSFATQYAAYVAPATVIQATPMANEENATIFTYDGTTASSIGAANPIWGGTFHLFDVPTQYPLFVVTSALNKIYSTLDIKHYETPTDDQQNSTILLEHDFGVGQETHALVGYGNDIVFAAHAAGAFGATVSKITELSKSSYVVSSITDADGRTTSEITIPYFKTIADTTISTSTNALKGGASGNNLATLGSSVNLAFTLQNLFIGVDATASGVAGSCATALTFAVLNSTYTDFLFYEVAPASILTTGAATVVSAPAGGQVRIKNIAGIVTSTGLQYLIVARDNGTGPQTIYALPIVMTGTDMGKIADFTEIQNTFVQKSGIFSSRQFTTQVSSFAQIDPAGTFASQLLVGGALPLNAPNNIAKLYTVGDSVYVVLGSAYAAGQKPGTFQSQPIYAQDGHIVGWTAWSRVLGSDDRMNYSFVDRKTLSGYYISHVTTNFRAVNQTTFTASSFMEPLLSQSSPGGTQGMFNFGQSTSGFNNAVSLLACTGYGQVVIGQTGANNGGGFFAINDPVTTVSFAGSNVNNHKALIACDIGHNGTNHFLFVGGSTGVSVLTDNTNGYTWNGNLANVAALNAGQTFKLVGDFKFVKKLVADATYIYILTSTELYRIALDANKFKATPTATLSAELVLSASALSQNPAYFLDIIIDNGFCVIGSTAGLFSMDVTAGQALNQITIPSGLPTASQLIAYSSSAQPQRSFKTLSNLVVLNNSFGLQQARINRFVITNGVIVPFDDFLVANRPSMTQGIPSSFIKFDNYINNYFSDGSWNIASSYYLGLNQPTDTASTPSVLQLFAGIRTGYSSSQLILPMFSAYAPLGFIFGFNLAGFIRESTSGSVIGYGTFPTNANV